MILRTKKIQNYLNNIAHIKNLLINLHYETRISEKSEKLKFELLDKLPKINSNFYLEFYKLKKNDRWVKALRINTFIWAEDYFQSLYRNNNKIDNSIIFQTLNENYIKKK